MTKPVTPISAYGKSGRYGVKDWVLIPGDLSFCQRLATDTVKCREGKAEVSRSHSTYWNLSKEPMRKGRTVRFKVTQGS
jgi:hypothetical protein